MSKTGALWRLAEIEFQDACQHFRRAANIIEKDSDLVGAGEVSAIVSASHEEYVVRMGLLHAMQCGHTSLEKGLLQTLKAIQEPFFEQGSWHRDLIARCAEEVADRPAILDAETASLAQVTRGFRNWAARRYGDSFYPKRARHAVQCAELLSDRLIDCFRKFVRYMDPTIHSLEGGESISGDTEEEEPAP